MKKETIGPKIKEFRRKRNLTQDELAESLGYSGKSVISHIEKGDADMTYEKILLLIRRYMVDANELFEVQEIDRKIAKWKFDQRKERKVAVYIHGLFGSSEEAKDFGFLKDSYDVVGLDYKDRNPWELKEKIRSEFRKLTDNYKEIIVIANSLGAFYTYEYLSDFNIKQAFFISPVADMCQLIINKMMDERISLEELEHKKLLTCQDGTVLSFDFYKHIENDKDGWEAPTDILYGEKDNLIYIENIANFLANHPNARLTIKKDAKHYFHTIEEKEFIKDWILKSLD